MKTKIIILLAVSALVTLSFTFASTKKEVATSKPNVTNAAADQAPIGGFEMEDKL